MAPTECVGRNRSIRRALVSVHDKSGLGELAHRLSEMNVEILSTGGTADAIRAEGIEVSDLSGMTGFRELLGGRVKSLHPAVHAAILARRDVPDDLSELDAHGIGAIDLLVVNFYPFGNRSPDAGVAETTELIDIGGPALVRAAAKNHVAVTVITSPEDYPELLQELATGGGTTGPEFRRRNAAKAFSLTSAYDAGIASWLWDLAEEECPPTIVVSARDGRKLAYGENPHQGAAHYTTVAGNHGIGAASQHCGKPLGYNNLLDADAALSLASEFDAERHAVCAIIKHGTPCGAAAGGTPAEAFEKAWSCDPISAFGGVIAFNCSLDEDTASMIADRFVEVVLAPGVSDGAVKAIQERRPGLRLLACPTIDPLAVSQQLRSVSGGLLVQDRDIGQFEPDAFSTVTGREPTEQQWADLEFAWKVAKHAKSNAVVLASSGAAVGIGAGQTSRVVAVEMAAINLLQHHLDASPLVAASDGFFPFVDGLEAIAAVGASAVIQPGGSRNDPEVISAANRLGLAMVFTGRRSFRH